MPLDLRSTLETIRPSERLACTRIAPGHELKSWRAIPRKTIGLQMYFIVEFLRKRAQLQFRKHWPFLLRSPVSILRSPIAPLYGLFSFIYGPRVFSCVFSPPTDVSMWESVVGTAWQSPLLRHITRLPPRR